MWWKDPKTGEKSVTVTILMVTFLVSIFKLLVSGMSFSPEWTFEKFSAADFATMIGTASALYWSRRNLNVDHSSGSPNKKPDGEE